MKKTPLTSLHIERNAKMVEYAGYYMPLQYSGLGQEHEAVRTKVGMFDVSHMGEFLIEGEKAKDLLQKITSNDVEKISVGKAQYTCLPNDNGGIVDDLIIYQLEDNKYMAVVNASNIDKDWDWFNKHNSFDVKLENISYNHALIAVQGPKSVETLQQLTDIDLKQIPYYNFEIGNMAGIENVIISNTGYTGSGGFELYIHNENAQDLWKAIEEAGKQYDLTLCGLAARDTLRLEMGFCLYGNDINDTTSPLEAGLGWITKFNKDFVNSDSLKKEKEEGSTRKLVAFKMEGKGIPRKDYTILNENGDEIGEVTSGTQSPSLGYGIGLGYVKTEFRKIDTPIQIQIRNKTVEARIVKPPFYKV